MKFTNLNSLLGISIISISIIILSGCATPEIVTPEIPYQPAITNAETGVITAAVPAQPAVITNVPNKTVTAIVNEGNAVVPFVPAPYNGILSGILGVLAAAASLIAARKNKQLSNIQAVTSTIIQGVESAGTAAAAVKQAIAKTAAANGTADAVESQVNKITGSQ